MDRQTFWGQGRSLHELSAMLRESEAVVSAWHSGQLVGFGRATSDGVFRAVLWDVVVAKKMQRNGLGRTIVRELLAHPKVAGAEKIYLMTTKGMAFYETLGFEQSSTQKLMHLKPRGRVEHEQE